MTNLFKQKATNLNKTEVIFSYYRVQSKSTITITETYYRNPASLSQQGIPFTVNGQTLKISVQITNWPFAATSTLKVNYRRSIKLKIVRIPQDNSFVLTLQVGQGETTLSQDTQELTLSSKGFNRTATNFTTSHTHGELSFLNFAYFNRSGSSGLEAIHIQREANESNANVTIYTIQFPGAFTDAIYDPDFGVLISPQSTSSGTCSHTFQK